jgi:hypothetical protein
MKVGTVSSSLAGRFGRLDAGFLLAIRDHVPLIEELMANLNAAGLVDLARTLPRDWDAFHVIYSAARPRGGMTAFDAWLAGKCRPADVAAYCALASQHAASKVLSRVEALRREELEALAGLKSLVDAASRPGTPRLEAAIKGKSTPRSEEDDGAG